MQVAEHRQMFAAAGGRLQACTPPGSGYLFGSFAAREDSRVLEVKDSLGQITLVFVCFLPSLIVSALPPSGCVVSNAHLPLGGWLHFSSIDSTELIAPFDYPESLESAVVFSVPRPLAHEPAVAQTRLLAPAYKDVVRDVQEAYGLHTTDLAELLQVSRQSVHSWKSDGGSAPNRTSATKLLRLFEGASEWRREFISRSPGWLLLSSFRGRPLKGWLSAVAEGEVRIAEIVSMVRDQVTEAAGVPPRLKMPAIRERTAFESFVDTLPDEGSAERDDETQS